VDLPEEITVSVPVLDSDPTNVSLVVDLCLSANPAKGQGVFLKAVCGTLTSAQRTAFKQTVAKVLAPLGTKGYVLSYGKPCWQSWQYLQD
jgi:hypothetical protein